MYGGQAADSRKRIKLNCPSVTFSNPFSKCNTPPPFLRNPCTVRSSSDGSYRRLKARFISANRFVPLV